MSGIDNRIVTMQFNNREFERNAQTSMGTIAKLKASLDFGAIAGGTVRALGLIDTALSKIGLKTPFSPMIKAANTGLSGIGFVLDKLGLKNPFGSSTQGASELQRAAQAAGGPQGMGVLEGGVTAVSSKFIALSTIAITALSNITNRAINAGTTFLKSFTIQPIMDGMREYETTLQSIQTVQANTDAPLKEVEASLQRLNAYSDTTIYNFGQMAKNVGTFTAAGVDLETSVASIQGIANIAALSGSSAEQAAMAMYQLSQAIAAGKVGLMDWNSVVNAGMGGKKLQNALLQTAVAMGEIEQSSVKLVGPMKKLTVNGQSFRESIMAGGDEPWLSSEVLVNTLAALDGRFSVAYQKAQLTEKGVRKFTDAQIKSNMAEARANLEKKNGVKYSDAQYKELLKMAEASTKAAQDVKTLGQVFSIARETIGSGWAASFKNVFGNLKEAKVLFTGMSTGLGDIIRANALARNELLSKWGKLGGRDTLIDGLKDAWSSFYSVIQAVGKGFRDVFPKKTATDLVAMTQTFADFMHSLLPSKETLADIRDIAGGVFAVFHIGKQILSGVVDGFKALFDSVGGGNGNFLDFFAAIGNGIKEFDAFLEKSGLITTFFTTLGQILSVPLALLAGVGDIIGSIFGGFDAGAAEKVGDAVGVVGERLSGIEVIGERLRSFFSSLGNVFANLGKFIGESLVKIGDVVASAFTADTFGKTLDVINTTLLGALVLLIRNFFTKGVKIDLTGGLFDGIKETLGSATSAFENMQNTLKADILLKLAGAIAVMAAALLVLSMIDPGALTKALGAMTAGFGILIGAMAVLMKTMGAAGIVQLYVITSGMTKMALSILLLAFALKTLASIKFGDMLRGLVGLAIMMKIISKVMPTLAANSKGMVKASSSLILLGIALNILALALKVFASMSWEEMIKGLVGMTAVLIILAGALKIMPDMKAEGIGLVLLAVAMNILALALKMFATMSWGEIVKGLVTLAGALFIISAAINTMPKTMMLQAAALVLVAGALTVLAGALKIMGSMSWDEIKKGLIALGVSLLMLALGLQAIGVVGTVGAVGLLAAAAALAIFAPVMLALGAMKWSSIIKSLVVLAGIFVILGVAGYFLAPLTPVLMGLGVALLLMGAGLALAGAGALAAAMAFGIVVAAGSAGIQILAAMLATIIQAIPPAMAAFAEGLVRFVTIIGENAPAVAAAFGKVLIALIDKVIEILPKIGQLMQKLVNLIIKVLTNSIPRLANAGLRMITGLLKAFADNVGKIADQVTRLIVAFLQALGRNLPKIIDAGVKMIIKLLEGIAKAIRNNDEEFGRAGADVAIAIVEGTVKGLGAAGGQIKDKMIELAKDAWGAVKNFFGINSPSRLMRDTVGRQIAAGMAEGISGSSGLVTDEMEVLGKTAAGKMDAAMKAINDAFMLDPNMSPTVTPVLDLARLTQEANKMSAILATAPIIAGFSYQTAADISALTSPPPGGDDGSGGTGGSGDQYNELNLHLHSPKPIDSVEAYRGGKTLISLAKEALA